jgi:hypothetical protein
MFVYGCLILKEETMEYGICNTCRLKETCLREIPRIVLDKEIKDWAICTLPKNSRDPTIPIAHKNSLR